MERCIVGVLIHADSNGEVTYKMAKFPIARETDKTAYPDKTGMRDSEQVIRYLSQMRKKELGWVESDTYPTGFSFQSHDIVETEEELSNLINKVKARAIKELAQRNNLVKLWTESFNNVVIG